MKKYVGGWLRVCFVTCAEVKKIKNNNETSNMKSPKGRSNIFPTGIKTTCNGSYNQSENPKTCLQTCF